MEKLEELSDQLREVDASLTADIDRLFYPNGRQEAYERISRMCELPTGAWSIDRTPSPFWKTNL
jgi:hypothetical protein